MAHKRQRSRPPPPPDDHDLKQKVTAAIAGFAQGIGRGLVVIIWEWVKTGHHM